MTRNAELAPDSILMLALLVDALGDHPHPQTAAENEKLRAQWEAAGELQQRRVLTAIAREARHQPPTPHSPRQPHNPASEYAHRLQQTATTDPEGEPELGPTIPQTGVALPAALLLLDRIRGGRDRPGHTGPGTPEEEEHMGRAEKPTIAAAKAEIARGGAESAQGTQGHLVHRHIREHTPKSLYPEASITGDDSEESGA